MHDLPRTERDRLQRGVALRLAERRAVVVDVQERALDGTKSPILVDHARYFAAPNPMLGTALLAHASSPVAGRWRALYRELVARVLVVGAYVHVAQPDPNLVAGPDGCAEIAAWCLDPRRPVHTWSVPWRMRHLPRER